MSTLREPVGPKSRKVYRRRRLLVLLGIIALAAAIVLIILKPGGSGGAQTARQVEVPEDIVTAGTEPASDDPDVIPGCASGQLRVTAITSQNQYAEGEQPLLSLTVENTGKEDCAADLGDAGMQFVVSSGSDEVWRSSDCQLNPANLAVILEPGKPLETEQVTWDRTRSSPDTCDVTRDAVGAGGATYHVRAMAAGVQSQGTAQFLLY